MTIITRSIYRSFRLITFIHMGVVRLGVCACVCACVCVCVCVCACVLLVGEQSIYQVALNDDVEKIKETGDQRQ